MLVLWPPSVLPRWVIAWSVSTTMSQGGTLRQGGVPIYERHLSDLLAKHLDNGVEFTSNLAAAVEASEAIFIAVGTPQGDAGAASPTSKLWCGDFPSITDYKVMSRRVRFRSTPMNGFIVSCSVTVSIRVVRRGVESRVSARGDGDRRLPHPDRIVVGANSDRAADVLRRIYLPLTEADITSNSMLCLVRAAPLLPQSCGDFSSKRRDHQARLQLFPALKISFINAMANLAESVDADIEDIAAGMGMDSRIGSKFLRAGLGYGGSCFPKDLAAFHWVAQQQGVDFQLLHEVRRINETQKEIFFDKVRTAPVDLAGQTSGGARLAFKGGTDDIRESPAVDMIRKLLGAGARVAAYDPAANERAAEVLPAFRGPDLCRRCLRGCGERGRRAHPYGLEGIWPNRPGTAEASCAFSHRH